MVITILPTHFFFYESESRNLRHWMVVFIWGLKISKRECGRWSKARHFRVKTRNIMTYWIIHLWLGRNSSETRRMFTNLNEQAESESENGY